MYSETVSYVSYDGLLVSDKYNYNTKSDLFHIYNLHRNEMTD